MVVNIHKLIAAISPDIYCKDIDERTGKPIRKEVKDMVKKEGFLKAAEIAKPKDSEFLDVAHVRLTAPAFALTGLKAPKEMHTLIYDAFSQNLEPIYFWILDYINREYESSEKLVDNFIAAAGSGYFSELQQRATRMQEEAMKIFGTANTVLRSILNIVYDLKDFETRLELYDRYNKPKDEEDKTSALFSLKQVWLDSVDFKRGNSSIKALAVGGANQPNFITLIDAFMAADTLEDVSKLDLNERVKRILEQRIPDFRKWILVSEKELRKRFEIEKTYLKSQVSSLQIYARWIKPYLKAAKDLEQRADPTSALVNSFNSAIFELILLGEDEYNPEGDIQQGELPKSFRRMKLRKYVPLIIVEFNFRGAPDRSDQRGGFGYRGRAEIKLTSYALNEDELKVLKEKIREDDVGDMFSLIEDATTNSLGEIKEDIDHYLNSNNKEKEEEEENDDSNPFSALFSFIKKGKKEDKKDLSKGIPSDSTEEKVLRSQAILEARWKCRKLYLEYKKSMEMPALPPAGLK